MADTTATFGTSNQTGVATDETNELIASNKVEGTEVYNRQGDHLGEVYNFMVNKRSGQVEYAVLSFGGFLGMAKAIIRYLGRRSPTTLSKAGTS